MKVSTEGSEVPTVLAVYTGASLLGLELVAQNNSVATLGYSVIQFPALRNLQYLVAVDTIGGVEGNIQLNWNLLGENVELVISEFAVSEIEVTLNITGPVGRIVIIQASNDLGDWTDVHVHVHEISGSTAVFTDSQVASQSVRFYRAVLE